MFYSIVKQARILQACQKGIYEPIEVTFVPFLVHGLLLSNYCLYFYLKLGVLAASSQFFASFLPQGELENEICISTDLLYSVFLSTSILANLCVPLKRKMRFSKY